MFEVVCVAKNVSFFKGEKNGQITFLLLIESLLVAIARPGGKVKNSNYILNPKRDLSHKKYILTNQLFKFYSCNKT